MSCLYMVIFNYLSKYFYEQKYKMRVFNAIKPGSIHQILHLKMPIPNKEYESCCQFVRCVLLLDFAILLGKMKYDCQ